MKILLPIDSSQGCRKAVEFMAKMLAGSKLDISLTLYHVIETLPEYLLARGNDSIAGTTYRQIIDDLTASRRTDGERLLSSYKQLLLSSGIPAASLHCKLEIRDALPEAKKVIAALAIIDEMKAGDYSVICLGRRGNGAARGFLGSVAEKILNEAEGRSVWVVD